MNSEILKISRIPEIQKFSIKILIEFTKIISQICSHARRQYDPAEDRQLRRERHDARGDLPDHRSDAASQEPEAGREAGLLVTVLTVILQSYSSPTVILGLGLIKNF